MMQIQAEEVVVLGIGSDLLDPVFTNMHVSNVDISQIDELHTLMNGSSHGDEVVVIIINGLLGLLCDLGRIVLVVGCIGALNRNCGCQIPETVVCPVFLEFLELAPTFDEFLVFVIPE